MGASILREKLISYLSKADNKKIEALYTLLEEEIEEDVDFSLSEEQKSIIDEDRKKFLNGEGESYNWEEAKEIIKGKKAI